MNTTAHRYFVLSNVAALVWNAVVIVAVTSHLVQRVAAFATIISVAGLCVHRLDREASRELYAFYIAGSLIVLSFYLYVFIQSLVLPEGQMRDAAVGVLVCLAMCPTLYRSEERV